MRTRTLLLAVFFFTPISLSAQSEPVDFPAELLPVPDASTSLSATAAVALPPAQFEFAAELLPGVESPAPVTAALPLPAETLSVAALPAAATAGLPSFRPMAVEVIGTPVAAPEPVAAPAEPGDGDYEQAGGAPNVLSPATFIRDIGKKYEDLSGDTRNLTDSSHDALLRLRQEEDELAEQVEGKAEELRAKQRRHSREDKRQAKALARELAQLERRHKAAQQRTALKKDQIVTQLRSMQKKHLSTLKEKYAEVEKLVEVSE